MPGDIVQARSQPPARAVLLRRSAYDARPAPAQVVASDFVLPANQQRAQGSAAPLYTNNYNVTLPGAQTGRCLGGASSSGAAEGVPVQLAAAAGGDGVYCGPLEGAPPGRAAFQPESVVGAEAGGPPPMPAAGAAPQPPPAGGAGGATPPSPPGSGGSSGCQASAAFAAGAFILAAALLAI